MLPCKRVTHGFLCKPRYRVEVPPHLRPQSITRGPTGDALACVFLAHRTRDGGEFWLVDCTLGDAPRVHAVPVSLRPSSFVVYTRDGCAHIVLTRDDEMYQIRYSLGAQTADPMRAVPRRKKAAGCLLACSETGDLVLADDPARAYYNHAEGCAYELDGDVLRARALPARSPVAVSEGRVETTRELDAGRRAVYFASVAETVVGPGPGAAREHYVVVPWPCRVHPHTLRYARAEGRELRLGACRAAGWDETRAALDGEPVAWEWLDGDGLCAATETSVWVLFADVERLGWADFVQETLLYRVPFLALLAWIVAENQVQ